MDWILGKMSERSSCGASFGNVKISDLDFTDDAAIFAEMLDILNGSSPDAEGIVVATGITGLRGQN